MKTPNITASHAVEEVSRYVMDGKEFRTLSAAIQSREDKIGAILDSVGNTLGLSPGQKLNLVQWCLENRTALSRLLDF